MGSKRRGRIKILHLADLHLGYAPPFLGERASEWRRQRDQILKAAVDFALCPQNAVDAVIVAGDLFDTHTPPADLVQWAVHELKRLTAAGIAVVTVPGNHDEFTYLDSVYRQRATSWPGILVKNANAEKVAVLNVRGEDLHLYSLAYTAGLTRADKALASFPRDEGGGWHVAAFHGSLDWPAGERSLPLDAEALARAGYDYVALGHIHRGGEKRLGRTLAVYPGLLAGKGWHDPGCGQLAVAVLDGESGGARLERATVECPLCCLFQHLELDAGLYKSNEELIRAAEAQLTEGAVVRLVLRGVPAFALSAEMMRSALAPKVYHLEIADETEAFTESEIAAWSSENTLRGYFLRRMQASLEKAPDERQRQVVRRALIAGLKALGSGKR